MQVLQGQVAKDVFATTVNTNTHLLQYEFSKADCFVPRKDDLLQIVLTYKFIVLQQVLRLLLLVVVTAYSKADSKKGVTQIYVTPFF